MAVDVAEIGVERTKLELREDWLTGWSADPAGHADVDDLLRDNEPLSGKALNWLAVPRPRGAAMKVPVLHLRWHIALHRAASEVRETADAVLSPGVIGYRRGSDPDAPYAHRWRLFSASTRELAGDAKWVVFADIQKFFQSTPWAAVVRALGDLGSPTVALEQLARSLDANGLRYLPPGYGDARLLANLVLHPVDEVVDAPFVRWVDDYRLFVRNNPDRSIACLEQALVSVQLTLNRAKLRIVPAADAERENANVLASAYHPERDPEEVVSKKLHTLFSASRKDPIANRSSLRFVIARLKRERDAFAVDYALSALRLTPWELPRLAAYLAEFVDDDRVSLPVLAALSSAARVGDAWSVARLAPLAMRMQLAPGAFRGLAMELPRLEGTPAWGLLVRLLAVNGNASSLADAFARPSDIRAVLAGSRDLGLEPRSEWVEAEPGLAEALKRDPAPLPEVESLL